MYQAILFDLDGTLLDFDACVAHASREAFREAGFKVSDAASWTRIWIDFCYYQPDPAIHPEIPFTLRVASFQQLARILCSSA